MKLFAYALGVVGAALTFASGMMLFPVFYFAAWEGWSSPNVLQYQERLIPTLALGIVILLAASYILRETER